MRIYEKWERFILIKIFCTQFQWQLAWILTVHWMRDKLDFSWVYIHSLNFYIIQNIRRINYLNLYQWDVKCIAVWWWAKKFGWVHWTLAGLWRSFLEELSQGWGWCPPWTAACSPSVLSSGGPPVPPASASPSGSLPNQRTSAL